MVQGYAGNGQQQHEKHEHDADPAMSSPEPDAQPGAAFSLWS
jgi:hypothetical protein